MDPSLTASRIDHPDGGTPRGAASLTRWVGTLALVALLVILGTFGLLMAEQRSRAREDAHREVDARANLLADHASRLFEVADIALRNAARAVSGRSWEALQGSEDLSRQLAATSASLPYIEDVWLNDETGALRLTSFAFPAPVSNASDRDAFKAQLRPNDALYVGERIIGRVTGRPTFLLARRLQDAGTGGFRGMVSVTADLGYFSDYWAGMRLPESETVRLFRTGSLDVLVQHPAPPAGRGFEPVDRAIAEAAGSGADGATVDIPASERAGAQIAAYRCVGTLPVCISVALPLATVDAAWRSRMLGYGLLAALTLAALGTLTWFAFRQARREARAHAEIRAAQEALRGVNARLELTVAERTAELIETNEEIQRYAYIVSHDLRAPLVNIMGFTGELETIRGEVAAELAGKPAGPPILKDFDEALGFIKAAITRMEALIGAILRISREGGRTFNPEPLDMTRLVAGLVDAQRHQIETSGTRVSIGTLPDLTCDRLAIEQVFGNLLDNAVKYLDPERPGLIAVSGAVDGERVVYRVSDNGRGISGQDFQRVFELFRRSGRQDKAGEGIGLAHVKALVRSLGGRIDVASQLGEGSTFSVDLPLRPALYSPAAGRATE